MNSQNNDDPKEVLQRLHAVANDPGIHIPENIMTAMKNYSAVVEKLSQKMGRQPNTEDVAKELGLTVEQTESCARLHEMSVSFE